MFRKMTAHVAVLAAVAIATTSVALASPASANHGRGNHGSTTLSAGNGTVGVNQVLSASYDDPEATTSCDDEPGSVRFSFRISGGADLGTIDGTCAPESNGSYTPVATWRATMNWTPTSSGSVRITVTATRQRFGGSSDVGSASQDVRIGGASVAAPSKVRNLRVTGVSTGAVSLNWEAPASTGGSAITGYIVKWSGPTSGQVVANATNANIGTLSPNSGYTFSVAAANAKGWSDWVSVDQRTANAPAPAVLKQQTLVGPMWEGGGPKVRSKKWKTFNNSSNLDTNAGHEARLSAANRSASVRSVSFRHIGDRVQVRAVLRPGAKSGSFTLVEYSPAVPGFTAMRYARDIKVVK